MVVIMTSRIHGRLVVIRKLVVVVVVVVAMESIMIALVVILSSIPIETCSWVGSHSCGNPKLARRHCISIA